MNPKTWRQMTTADEKFDAIRDDILAIKQRTEEISDATNKAIAALEANFQRAIAAVRKEVGQPRKK